jgi:hypothetical protein
MNDVNLLFNDDFMLKDSIGYIVLTALLLGGSSCCQKRGYCEPGKLNVAFVGFSRTESRYVMLKRYKIGESKKALDSAQFIYNGTKAYNPAQTDTLMFSEYSTSGVLEGIKTDNDWELTLTSTGHKYKFTSVNNGGPRYEVIKCNGKEAGCVNEIANYTVNDQWREGNTLYIGR